MSLDIDALKAQYKQEEEEKAKREKGGSNTDWYAFWNMNFDETALVRFLPDADPAASHFVIEKFLHKLDVEVDGKTQRRNVPCLSMYGKPCPICEQSQAFYKEDDEKNGSRFWKKKSYIAQVLVQDSPFEYEGGEHKLINLESKIYEVIKKSIMMGDLPVIPTDYEAGYDFRLNKTKDGQWSTYVTSSFARQSTAVDLARLKDVELHILKDKLPREPSIEYVETVLHAALTGEPFVWENKKQSDNPEAKSVESKLPTKTKEPVEEKVKTPVAKTETKAVVEDKPVAKTDKKTSSSVLDIIANRKAKEAGA